MNARVSPPYANVREAYQHLIKYDSAPNLPKTAPNAPVTLVARNGYIHYRPYESFEAISRFMNSCIFYSTVIVNLQHFEDRYRDLQVKKMYRMITGKRFPDDHEKTAHQVVWLIFQSVPLTKMKAVTGNRHGNSYLFDLAKLSENTTKFPKQCMQIISAILSGQQSSYTLDDLKVFSNDLHKHGLKTKQPAFRILQYYLPQLFDAGYVEYPRKQYEKDEETENEDQ